MRTHHRTSAHACRFPSAAASADIALGKLKKKSRIKDSFGSFDRFNTSVTFGYKPVKWLKIAPAYHLFNIHDVKKSTGKKEWKARHRVALNMTASISAGRWKFSLRERPQVTMRTDSINVMEKCRASFVLEIQGTG